jgi:hypothetical protein
MTDSRPSVFESGRLAFSNEVADLPTPLWAAVLECAAQEEEIDFAVLHQGEVDPTLPLVIWVHPGDACESDHDDRDVRDISIDLQHQMGRELLQFGPCNAVVLHRVSSEYAFEENYRVADNYHRAMCEALVDERVTHLFGDDLNAASAWLIEHMATQQRPEIFLTGAWSHPEYGCVAAVGQALHAAGTQRLHLSYSSPSDPGDCSEVWQPPAPELAPAPTARAPKPR